MPRRDSALKHLGLTAVLVAAASSNPAIAQDNWQDAYRVGQQVRFTISGRDTDLQTCTVTENTPGSVMKVRCAAFRQWVAGDYIVYSQTNLATNGPQQQPPGGHAGARPAPAAPAFPAAAYGAGDEWRAAYRVGQQVRFTISERDSDLQTCTVTENTPGSVMRVRCAAFKQWVAGDYIVYGQSNLAKGVQQGAAGGGPVGAAPPPPPPPAAPRAPAAGGHLMPGEYNCYGVGGRAMTGLAFKVLPGGRYTDLEGGNPGTVRIDGGSVVFTGGHLGDMAGRVLPSGNFAMGLQAECERTR